MTFALMAVCFAMIIDPILLATAGKMHWVVAFREVHSRLCSAVAAWVLVSFSSWVFT
jgi:hypothetical protein